MLWKDEWAPAAVPTNKVTFEAEFSVTAPAEIRVSVTGNLVGGAGFQGRYDYPVAETPSVIVFVIMP